MIRPARPGDGAAIAAIWNPIIRDSLVTFTSTEKTPEGVAALIAERNAWGHAFLVAVQGPEVAGFATYSPFRSGPGYAQSMEHTIILTDAARGRGLGRALMAGIEAQAKAAGAHLMIGAISGANPAGLGFHARLGYREVGRLPEAGQKFGQWLDLVLMQKTL